MSYSSEEGADKETINHEAILLAGLAIQQTLRYTSEDIRQLKEIEKLEIKLETPYYRKLKALRNRLVENSSENFLSRDIPFTEYEQAEYTQQFANLAKERASKAILLASVYMSERLQEQIKQNFFQETVNNYWEKYGLKLSKEASLTSFNDIKTVIKDGMDKGLNNYQIAKNIKKVKDINKYRVQTIIRTETKMAMFAGETAVMDNIAMTTNKKIFKTWLSVRDKRVRPTHRVADGQTVPYNENFLIGGVYMKAPGDPEGGAQNVCNCRCVMSIKFTV